MGLPPGRLERKAQTKIDSPGWPGPRCLDCKVQSQVNLNHPKTAEIRSICCAARGSEFRRSAVSTTRYQTNMDRKMGNPGDCARTGSPRPAGNNLTRSRHGVREIPRASSSSMDSDTGPEEPDRGRSDTPLRIAADGESVFSHGRPRRAARSAWRRLRQRTHSASLAAGTLRQ